MKKWIAALAALGVSAGLAAGAAAADTDYIIVISDGTMTVYEAPVEGICVEMENGALTVRNDGEDAGSYALRTPQAAFSSQDGELLMRFVDAEGNTRLVSLGEETELTIDGAWSGVTLDGALSKETAVAVSGSVETLTIDAACAVSLEGEATSVVIGDAAAKLDVTGKAGTVDVASGRARVRAGEGSVYRLNVPSADVISPDRW